MSFPLAERPHHWGSIKCAVMKAARWYRGCRTRGIATVEPDLRGLTDQRASPACKWLIDKEVGSGELQRAGRWLQSRSKTLQTARRVKVYQPFIWTAAAAMLRAGQNEGGIEE